MTDTPIFHITTAREWDDARAAGEYRMSTRGQTLDDVGFIHASFAEQIERVAAFVHRDTNEALVVLTIDPARLTAPVVVEGGEGSDGDGERFPHIYGPLPIDAVVEVRGATMHPAGRLLIGE
jgi:uncharacterized protein (DUF952 family)